jgi:phytoene synthase
MEANLAAAYARCRELHRRHGRTYYLATRLLPPAKRQHVHALYGFTRYADDIVDQLDSQASPDERARMLRDWSARFVAGLQGEPVDDPVLPAVLDTMATYDMDRGDFAAFLRSMAMDLHITEYQTYADLTDYMEGSAAVIGTMMLPILGPAEPQRAREPARQLGLAFQLTNFIRDVGEDLDRGRVYLPQEDLRQFGLTAADLRTAARQGAASPAVRALIRFEVDRARRHYAAAASGLRLLTGASRRCIRVAYYLYGGILDEIVKADYDPFVRRAVVSRRRRLALVIRHMRGPDRDPVVIPGLVRHA